MNMMKRMILLIIIVFCVGVLNVNAAGVTIKSIDLVDHTGNATELSAPTISGLNIGFDLAFTDVNDSAKYEVILNNPTSTEYEISLDNTFSSSNYMEYSYEFKEKTNRIKANSEVVLYITIKYKNAVPSESLVGGRYIENNTLGITLLNENNPNTFNSFIFLLIILLGMVGFTILSKKMKNKNLLIIVIALLLVPVTVYGLQKLTLTVETKITIGEMHNIYYYYGDVIKASELNDNEYVYDDCYDEIRISNGNGGYDNYKDCAFIYKKESTSHVVGERISVKPLTVHSVDYDACTYNDTENLFYCNENLLTTNVTNSLSYGCRRIYDASSFDPGKSISTKGGLASYNYDSSSCSMNDLEVMNFNSIEIDEWVDYKYIDFNLPNQFTMPGHDVYFDLSFGIK